MKIVDNNNDDDNNDGACIYYKLTYEPLAQVSLKRMDILLKQRLIGLQKKGGI